MMDRDERMKGDREGQLSFGGRGEKAREEK